MISITPQYNTDDTRKFSVVIPIKEFETIFEELEELEDTRLLMK